MAMVARAAKQPLTAEMVTVDPPKAGEVRVKVIGTLCPYNTRTLCCMLLLLVVLQLVCNVFLFVAVAVSSHSLFLFSIVILSPSIHIFF
jgi:hypothetical protein